MIYWRPGFLAVVWFGSFPTPSLGSNLDRWHIGRLRKRDNLPTGVRGVGGGGARSHKKTWSSIIIQYSLALSITTEGRKSLNVRPRKAPFSRVKEMANKLRPGLELIRLTRQTLARVPRSIIGSMSRGIGFWLKFSCLSNGTSNIRYVNTVLNCTTFV
jgi:hypothetical protein